MERFWSLEAGCPVCDWSPVVAQSYAYMWSGHEVRCPRCGPFAISEEAFLELNGIEASRRCLISAWIQARALRRRRHPTILSTSYDKKPEDEVRFTVTEILETELPVTVEATTLQILENLAFATREPGGTYKLQADESDIALFWANSQTQRSYYVRALIAREWIRLDPGSNTLELTPQGWAAAGELTRRTPATKQVFVAMSFDPALDPVWSDGLRAGILDAGYIPLRVDMKEHNNKICDVIVAEIRRSKFLVADVTGQRAGVYFEAGYAMGLGLPVIWSCRADDVKNCHFDTRQYSHVRWLDEADLRLRIMRRIQGTIE